MMEQSSWGNGVRIVDRRGRRWFTAAYRSEVVALCRQPGVSVAGIALERGLNANLVRKWIAKQDGLPKSVPLLQVKLQHEMTGAQTVGPGVQSMVIRRADIEVSIGERASVEQIEAVISALR